MKDARFYKIRRLKAKPLFVTHRLLHIVCYTMGGLLGERGHVTNGLLFGGARVAADRLHHVTVGEGGDVAKGAPFGDIAKEAAHDLP